MTTFLNNQRRGLNRPPVKHILRVALCTTMLLAFVPGCTTNGNSASGNQVNFIDWTAEITDQATPLGLVPGIYRDVAWLDSDRIAFLYASGPDVERHDYQLAIYTPNEGLQTLTFQKPAMCIRGRIALLERLPNGKLGFIYTCSVYHGNVTGEISSLYTWDDQSNSFQELQQYPENFSGGSYAFAPDMTELLQDTWTGPGANQLYRVNQDGQMERLFPDFQSAISPSWSPDGQTIAFVGLKTHLGTVESLNDVTELVHYPNNIYLVDGDGKNLHSILSGIVMGGGTEWSPLGKLLSFGGQYQGIDGLWIFNTLSLQVTRIWSYPPATDWSPDGKQMVVIQTVNQNGVELDVPVIINLPMELYDESRE